MSLALTSKIEILKDRAFMLARARGFFAERNVYEVDVPILSQRASIDLHIDLIQATCLKKRAFLHSSPEYGMKRLLAEGMGDIYQISHVFREDERGAFHNPEFTMAEWYRMGISFDDMIEETLDFCRLFFHPSQTYEKMSYTQAFLHYVGYFPDSTEERDLIFAFEIEPHLGKDGFSVISGFPQEQAALARIGEDGMAKRFEIFYSGIELANGYLELLDPHEQKDRFEKANLLRKNAHKEIYPIDENFLHALEKEIPPCCGVACGFDRLMMLRHQVEEIGSIIPFAWENS